MAVRRVDRDLGAIGLMDTPRAAAREAIARLKALGIRRMIMISGDNQRVETAVAADVGIDEAWGDLVPEEIGRASCWARVCPYVLISVVARSFKKKLSKDKNKHTL